MFEELYIMPIKTSTTPRKGLRMKDCDFELV